MAASAPPPRDRRSSHRATSSLRHRLFDSARQRPSRSPLRLFATSPLRLFVRAAARDRGLRSGGSARFPSRSPLRLFATSSARRRAIADRLFVASPPEGPEPIAYSSARLNPGPIPFGGPKEVEVPAFTQAIEAHQRRITEAILEHALKICSEKNVEVKTEVVVGDPKEKICELTAEHKADLLVMGCRAFGPVKRMFLGSVSNYCVNSVCCPVVVIKGT